MFLVSTNRDSYYICIHVIKGREFKIYLEKMLNIPNNDDYE